MPQRGNAYHMGSHAGAWEPGKNQHQKSVNQKMKDAHKRITFLPSIPNFFLEVISTCPLSSLSPFFKAGHNVTRRVVAHIRPELTNPLGVCLSVIYKL